jgi:hypothetical protein
MEAHFFDIDVLVELDQKVLIVDKNDPDKALVKIPLSEYNLIKKRIYLYKDNKLVINGEELFFDDKLFDNIKVICKKNKININDIRFSLIEFNESDKCEYKIDYSLFKQINQDIYLICSKKTNEFYEKILAELKSELYLLGKDPKNIYYLIDDITEINDPDKLIYKKAKLLAQHLVGYKTDNNKFINEKLKEYDNVYYYDNNKHNITELKLFNRILKSLLVKTEPYLTNIITKKIKGKTLTINYTSPNKVNRFDPYSIDIDVSNKLYRFKDF